MVIKKRHSASSEHIVEFKNPLWRPKSMDLAVKPVLWLNQAHFPLEVEHIVDKIKIIL